MTQGNNATFTVTAGGTAPLSYQWCLDGTNLAGANDSAFTRTNAQATNSGAYTLIVTNNSGSVTSTVATLTLSIPPAEPGQFGSVSRLADGTVRLNMSGTPGATYTLQWTSDWVGWTNLCTVSGANGLFWVVDPCATNSSQRFYRLRPGP